MFTLSIQLTSALFQIQQNHPIIRRCRQIRITTQLLRREENKLMVQSLCGLLILVIIPFNNQEFIIKFASIRSLCIASIQSINSIIIHVKLTISSIQNTTTECICRISLPSIFMINQQRLRYCVMINKVTISIYFIYFGPILSIDIFQDIIRSIPLDNNLGFIRCGRNTRDSTTIIVIIVSINGTLIR